MPTTTALRTDPGPRSITSEGARLAEGERARDIQLTDITGDVVDLAGYPGRHVLLSFFRFASCPFAVKPNRL